MAITLSIPQAANHHYTETDYLGMVYFGGDGFTDHLWSEGGTIPHRSLMYPGLMYPGFNVPQFDAM